MSISIAGESDATRWKPLLQVPLYCTNQPRGLPLLLSSAPPSVSFILTSYITMEQRVHFPRVVHLCNEIKPSPFLPDLIRTALRLIWKCVCQLSTPVPPLPRLLTVCFVFLRSSLTCPHCLKQSNTFDPFLCISLPIPLRQTRWAQLFAKCTALIQHSAGLINHSKHRATTHSHTHSFIQHFFLHKYCFYTPHTHIYTTMLHQFHVQCLVQGVYDMQTRKDGNQTTSLLVGGQQPDLSIDM